MQSILLGTEKYCNKHSITNVKHHVESYIYNNNTLTIENICTDKTTDKKGVFYHNSWIICYFCVTRIPGMRCLTRLYLITKQS